MEKNSLLTIDKDFICLRKIAVPGCIFNHNCICDLSYKRLLALVFPFRLSPALFFRLLINTRSSRTYFPPGSVRLYCLFRLLTRPRESILPLFYGSETEHWADKERPSLEATETCIWHKMTKTIAATEGKNLKSNKWGKEIT